MSSNSLRYGMLGMELLSGAGGTYNVMDGQRGLGDPQAVVESVQAQLTQGSAVTGSFTDNRKIALTILVSAPSRTTLSAACELLASAANAAVNTLIWSPEGGLPMVFDTWRGQVTTTWSGKYEGVFARVMQITFDALPFGRSDQRVTISGSSSTIQLGDFSTPADFDYTTADSSNSTLMPDLLRGDASDVPNVTIATVGASEPTAVTGDPAPYEGSGSSRYDARFYKSADTYTYQQNISLGDTPNYVTTTVPARGTAAVAVTPVATPDLDLSANTRVVCAVYVADQTQCRAYLTIGDGTNTQTFAMSTSGAGQGGWSTFGADLTGSTVDLAAITSWTLTVAAGPNYDYTTGLAAIPILLGMLRAYPVSSSLVTTTNGGSYQFAGIPGSAPAPATLTLDRGGTDTLSGILVYLAPSGSTAPALVALSGASPSGATVTPGRLAGTYRIILAAGTTFDHGGTVTITQNVNGSTVATKTLTGVSESVKWGSMGELTFPFVDVPDQASDVTYGFSYDVPGATEALLIDTRGALVWVPTFTAAKYVWIDEATAANGLGGVWAGNLPDKSDAVSLLGAARLQISGSSSLVPGNNTMLVYCLDGLPNVAASFWPRWIHERSA